MKWLKLHGKYQRDFYGLFKIFWVPTLRDSLIFRAIGFRKIVWFGGKYAMHGSKTYLELQLVAGRGVGSQHSLGWCCTWRDIIIIIFCIGKLFQFFFFTNFGPFFLISLRCLCQPQIFQSFLFLFSLYKNCSWLKKKLKNYHELWKLFFCCCWSFLLLLHLSSLTHTRCLSLTVCLWLIRIRIRIRIRTDRTQLSGCCCCCLLLLLLLLLLLRLLLLLFLLNFCANVRFEFEIEIVRFGWTNFSNWTDRIKKLNCVPKKCS